MDCCTLKRPSYWGREVRLWVSLLCFWAVCDCGHPVFAFDLKDLRAPTVAGKIRGITLAPIEDTRLGQVGYGSKRCAMAMADISIIGANWIALTPFGRMDDLDSTDIQHDFEIPIEQNEKMLLEAAAQAKAAGLRVALIPHIYVMSGKWRGEIDPGIDERFTAWFDSYERFIMRFAALAEEMGADLFSIGVEFGSSTNIFSHEWRRIILMVRSVYKGALTYSANWDEVEYVDFWDDLDLIGINAFWPLAEKPGDGFAEMHRKVFEVAESLSGLSLFWNRPVIFTEFGVKSASDAALAPWEWPEHCGELVYDEDYQAIAYQAVFEVMVQRPWFEGLFIWKYFSDPFDETQEAKTGFSPREKQAEKVLSAWYFQRWDLAQTCSFDMLNKY